MINDSSRILQMWVSLENTYITFSKSKQIHYISGGWDELQWTKIMLSKNTIQDFML